MKPGIPLLITGVIILVLSIPFSIMLLIVGYNQMTVGDVSGGVLAYAPIAGVVVDCDRSWY